MCILYTWIADARAAVALTLMTLLLLNGRAQVMEHDMSLMLWFAKNGRVDDQGVDGQRMFGRKGVMILYDNWWWC